MADEASDTFGGSVRNYLGALGFILPLVGFEELIRHFVDTEHPSLPWWVSAAFIIAGYPIYSLPAIWKYFGGGKTSHRPLEYLSYRDSDLGSAIISAARRSAYGRWFAAQNLINSGNPIQQRLLLHTMASQVLDKILDGEIEVRGRKPGQMDHEAIPRAYWRSSAFHVVEDPLTLWRIILCPRGVVEFAQDGTVVRTSDAASAARTSQLADYDSLLVDAYQFEKIWPKTEKLADGERRQFLKEARRRGLNNDEIQRLSDPPKWRRIGFPLTLFAAIGAILVFAYIAGPQIYRMETQQITGGFGFAEATMPQTQPTDLNWVDALYIESAFIRLPRPCAVRLTPATEADVNSRRILAKIITEHHSCDVTEVGADDGPFPKDVDKPPPQAVSGLIVRWHQENASARASFDMLKGNYCHVVEGHGMPDGSPQNLIWIVVGSGYPWHGRCAP